MPVGTSSSGDLDGTRATSVQSTSSQQRAAGQAGLHEVPVAEQHRVGDRRRGTRRRRRTGRPPATAGRRRRARRRPADEADDRGDEVEHGGRTPRPSGPSRPPRVDAGHGRHPGRAGLGQRDLPATRRPCGGRSTTARATPAATATPTDASVAHRHRVEHEDPDVGRAGGHDEVDAPHQPAVAEADLAAAGGDPQEEQAAGRPLEQDGGGVEADHRVGASGAQASTATRRVVGAVEARRGRARRSRPRCPRAGSRSDRAGRCRARPRRRCPATSGRARCRRRCTGPRAPRRRCRGRCGG